MSDQFSRTISSVNDVPKIEHDVKRSGRVEDRRVENKTDTKNKRGQKNHYPFSDYILPANKVWDGILEAVEMFNQHQELINSPYVIRLWAQNNKFRVQVIHESTGELYKQTKLISFEDASLSELNAIINELIAERGIIVDITG